MKRFILAILITVVAFGTSIAAPVNDTNKAGTESHFQAKKKSGKKHHKKQATKKRSGTKKK